MDDGIDRRDHREHEHSENHPLPSPVSLPWVQNPKPDSSAVNRSTYSLLLTRSRSALSSLQKSLRSLPAIKKLSLPAKRTLLFNPATIHNSGAEIFTIAFKKLIVVFLSTHVLTSTGPLLFALIRWSRAINRGERRKLSQVIKDVLLDPSTRRFASFVGFYSALWTTSFPALLKLRTETQSGLEFAWSSKVSNGNWKLKARNFCADWAAAGAGMIAGLAILNETHDQRVSLGLNIFCRGLYGLAISRPLFRLPCGDILLFAMSNAQIMSAFILYPETLPRWYWHWIRRAGTLETGTLDVHRKLNLGLVVSQESLDRMITQTIPRSHKDPIHLDKWVRSSVKLDRLGVPCHFSHPSSHSCLRGNLVHAWEAYKYMLPTYTILHLIPSFLFRNEVLMKTPLKFVLSIIKKVGKSGLFIASFVWIFTSSFCVPPAIYQSSRGRINLGGWTWQAVSGFVTCLSLYWEDSKRRGELALYCAPKALNSIWQVLKSKRLVKSIKYGEVILTSLATGIIMNCFINNPDRLPPLVRGIIDQLVDPHLPALRGKKKKITRTQLVKGGKIVQSDETQNGCLSASD